MRAAVLTSVETPFEFKELPDPEPGPGQVRIQMKASGLCGTDVHVYHGHFPIPLPAVLGHEPVGVVEKLGAGVTTLKLGDRVGASWAQGTCGRCRACQRGESRHCAEMRTWVQNGGGNSALMIADAQGVSLLPEGLGFEEAAPIFCAGYTAMSGYRNAQPKPGEKIAVIGIGGLGHLALQIAKAYGHQVLAITSSADKRAEAKALGADEVLVVRKDAGAELKALGGVDVVLSTSNAMDQNSQVIAGLRPGGRYVNMALGGPLTVPSALLLSGIQIIGSSQDERADLIDCLELVRDGKVKPKLEVYAFNDINKALGRLRENQVRYRAVIQLPA